MKHLLVLASIALFSFAPFAKGQSFAPPQAISTPAIPAGQFVIASDVDGDGDKDAVLATKHFGKVAWYENLGGGSFGPEQVITSSLGSVDKILAIDLDGDGDEDLLASSFLVGQFFTRIIWHENLGGGFGPEQVLTATCGPGQDSSFSAADLDGDGDTDVLSACYQSSGIAWHENLGGGVFSPQQAIHATSWKYGVYAIDFDGDGDSDVLSRSVLGVEWYENLGGGVFGPEQTVWTTGDFVSSLNVLDFDGDGDVDILTATLSNGVSTTTLEWAENLGGGVFSPPKKIPGSSGAGPFLSFGDLDGDGDDDIISVVKVVSFIGLVGWLENLGGGMYGPLKVINTLPTETAFTIFPIDADGDGDIDVLSAHSVLAWWENLGDIDCNLNGIPDDEDLTLGTSLDCNRNGIPDECDLASGFSTDLDGDGQLDDCVAPSLYADVFQLSIAAGGTQTFALTTPMPPSFEMYLLMGTTSGTTPGTANGGFIVPLNVDSYLLHTVQSPLAAPLTGAVGAMTPSGSGGTATASFTLPPAFSPSLIGLTLHHAFVTIDLIGGSMNFVSNAVPLALLP